MKILLNLISAVSCLAAISCTRFNVDRCEANMPGRLPLRHWYLQHRHQHQSMLLPTMPRSLRLDIKPVMHWSSAAIGLSA